MPSSALVARQLPKDLSPGWEARAVERWMKANICSVPSHLLPAVTVIYSSFIHQAMLPAPQADSQVPSELRLQVRQRAKREGRSKEFKQALAEWTLLLHRGFLTAEGRKRTLRRFSQLAKDIDSRQSKDAIEKEHDPPEVSGLRDQLDDGNGPRLAKGKVKRRPSAIADSMEEEEEEDGMEGGDRNDQVVGDNEGMGEATIHKSPPVRMTALDMCGLPAAGRMPNLDAHVLI